MIASAAGQVGGENLAASDNSSTALDAGTEGAKASKEVRVVAIGTGDLASNSGVQRAENIDMF